MEEEAEAPTEFPNQKKQEKKLKKTEAPRSIP